MSPEETAKLLANEDRLNPLNETHLSGQGEVWEQEVALQLIRRWAEGGLTYKQLATNMGITSSTLSRWRKDSPLIQRAIDRGRQKADIEVTNALFKSAVGGTVKERREETRVDADGLVYDTKIVEVEREVKGDVSAQTFWLKNRAAEEWKDKQDTDRHVLSIGDANEAIMKYIYLRDDDFLVEENDGESDNGSNEMAGSGEE